MPLSRIFLYQITTPLNGTQKEVRPFFPFPEYRNAI
jgi:hypothetical protein